jgi:hypothetical protein
VDEEDEFDEDDEDDYDSHTSAPQVNLVYLAPQQLATLQDGGLPGVHNVGYGSIPLPGPEEIEFTSPQLPVPNKTGEKLMRGSDFGSVGVSALCWGDD